MRRQSTVRVLSLLAVLAWLLAGATARASSPVVVVVDANAASVDTGITLGPGQQATITADGQPYCQSEGTSYPCYDLGPDGATDSCEAFSVRNCPGPKLPAWSLVGRVNTGGDWRFVGAGPTTIVGPGRLYLAYNDDGFDNFGEFTATIAVSDLSASTLTAVTASPASVGPRAATIPLGNLPSADPLGRKTDALASAPLRSSPLRSSPLRSSPLRSSPLRSSPLRSSALGALSLAELPLRSSSWDALLAGTSLDVPPASLTLDQVLSLNPLPASLAQLSLADLDLAHTPLRSSSLAEVLLAGAPLSKLAPPNGTTWCAYFFSNDCDLSSKTLADVLATGQLDDTDLGKIQLNGSGSDISGSVLASIALADLDLSATPLASRSDLGQYATVGDLVAALPLPGLATLSLGDLLPGLVAPASLPLELAPLSTILAAAPRQTTGLLRYRVDVNALCDAGNLDLQVTLPPSARYVPGSASALVGSTTVALPDPANTSGLTLGYDLIPALDAGCLAGDSQAIAVTFDVEPPAHLGVPTLQASLSADGGAFGLVGPTNARVDDVDDPGNTPATAATITAGTLRTGYIATPDDADAYALDAPPVGSTVTVTLSHLPADYDLTVTGPPVGVPAAPLRSSPLRSSPLRSSTIGDDSTSRTAPINPAALQDLPLRSSELSSTPLRSSSIGRGLSTESTTFTVTPDDAGKRFTLHVTGYAGAHSDDPYVLRVSVDSPKSAPTCRAARSLPSAAKGAFPSLPLTASTKTIFLINQQRLAQLYPSADIAALRAKLDALAARPEVAGAVVPVESDPANPTASAYAAWDANPCSVVAANGVAGAIRAVIGNVTQNLNGLKNIVVIGGDAVIPQVRVPDLTGTANESEEADALVFGGKDSAASRSLRDGFLLTDDGYGDFDPETGLAGAVFVPDVALGRLVETPAQIGQQIDLYTGASGALSTQSAHVSGYDFLTDGAQAMLAQLSGIPGIQTSSAINETWTAADAKAALNRATPGITSVNAHYDQYRALPAAAFNGLVPDLLSDADIAPAAGSMLFTAGCHAGLNLENVDFPDATSGDAAKLRDWAQQVTTRAVYVANTTFGYGDTDTVAYSERLLGLLAEGVASRQVTAGQALMIAKQRYAAEQATPGVYDQKSSMGLTFYGLPFFTIGASGGEAPAVLPSTPPAGTQVRSSAFSIDPQFVRHDISGDRSWWSVGDEAPQATHDRPIQPRTVKDVTANDGLPVHGAVVESLTDSTEFNVHAAYSDPTIDLGASEPATPESEFSGGLFPSWVLRTTRGATTAGLRDQLVAVPGQYDGNFSLQRLYPHIGGQVLRSDSTDYDPPVISATDAVQTYDGDYYSSPSTVHFTARSGASDVVRAVVLYRTDWTGGAWQKLELTREGTSDTWSGDGRLDAWLGSPAYVVQLVDAAGNVAVSTNKGDDYYPRLAGDPKAPEITTAPQLPASGWASGPVTVTLDPGATKNVTFQVSVDGAAPTDYTGPFTVTGDGVHTVRFVGSDGSQGGQTIRIDGSAPSVSGAPSPQPSLEGFIAGPATITWACADAASGVSSCPAPTTIATEGMGITVTSPNAADRAENAGGGTAGPFNVDLNPPTGTVGAGSAALRSGTIVPTAPLTSTTSVTGTATDSLAGIRSVQVTFTTTTTPAQTQTADATLTCAAADRRSCTWTALAPTTAGTWNVTAAITDRAGRTTTVAGSATITTGTTGGGGSDDDDDDHGHGGGSGGGNGGNPKCTTVVLRLEWRTIERTVVVKGKKVTVKDRELVWVKVTVEVPCCPKKDPKTGKCGRRSSVVATAKRPAKTSKKAHRKAPDAKRKPSTRLR